MPRGRKWYVRTPGHCSGVLLCLAPFLASLEVAVASGRAENGQHLDVAVLDSTGEVKIHQSQSHAHAEEKNLGPKAAAALMSQRSRADGVLGTTVKFRPPALSSLAGRWWLNQTSIGLGVSLSSTGSLSDQMGFVVPQEFKNNHSLPAWEAYPEFALKASQDDYVFQNFRQVYAQRQYAQIDGPSYGKTYVQKTMKGLLDSEVPNATERAVQVAAAVDAVGKPAVYPLWDKDNYPLSWKKDAKDKDHSSPANISGLTARYLKFGLDIERLFGNLSGFDVIELGVGFGGQASVLLSMFPTIRSYTLVDLPEVLHMADKFINQTAPADDGSQQDENGGAPRLKFLSGDVGIEPEQSYHLLISTFAYTEVPLQLRQEYFDKIVKRAEHGFIADSSGLTKEAFGDFSAAALPLQLLMGGVSGEDLLVFPVGLPQTDGGDDTAKEAIVAWNVKNEYFPKALNVGDTPNIKQEYPVRKLHRNCKMKFHGNDMMLCAEKKK